MLENLIHCHINYKDESMQSSRPIHPPLCESWTLRADTTRRIQAFENKFYRCILGISCNDNKKNEFVHRAIKSDRGSEKKKACVIWPHDSPQKTD